MALYTEIPQDAQPTAMPVEAMRTLLVCRGPIALETLNIYRRCHWQLPHVVVSSKEWTAERLRMAPWIAELPPHHVHYVQEYNDVEAVLQIAKAHRIDAIYPGYGFLAENAEFAERVHQAGVRFIGPTPEVLRTVGNKDAAIALAKRLSIPTIPGDDAIIDFARFHTQEAITAETIRHILALGRQYPGNSIRLKHPAGGGGKGQYVLSAQTLQASEAQQTIAEALAKVWAEMGVSAAEDDAKKGILLELNLARPLHWEVQLFGDGDTVVHFAARDCSLQNHASQKFIELALYPEALAQECRHFHPQRDVARVATLRKRLDTLERVCAAALRLGQAIRLRGAATVEFLIDQQGDPYFLEVNPRIQVEHAVTEGVSRVHNRPISLVELQQRVAAGEKLNFRQTDITFVGDAIEVRLNAWHEDLNPVLGGRLYALSLDMPPTIQDSVRIDAGGLLQRREPWFIPSYDANFALIVVTGRHRYETLERMLTVLDTALQVDGNDSLHTNLQPMLGLLTLMRAAPLATEFRTDTSLLWMACVAVLMTRKQEVLSLIPDFPRQFEPHDPARFARLLRVTLEAGMAHPSRLLTYYLKRLTDSEPRPLSSLEVLFQLAEELKISLFEEERQQCEALREASEILWTALSASSQRYTALIGSIVGKSAYNADHEELSTYLQKVYPDRAPDEATILLDTLLAWLSTDIPALTMLLQTIESTLLHTFLEVGDELALNRPLFLEDETQIARLHRFLSTSLRPTVLCNGELLSPMEATIFHQPEPGAPAFIQIGAEIHVGQTLALLEAMKMFSELASPVEGVLVDILVENGHGVKTGTPLFKIATQDAGVETADDMSHQIVDSPWQNRFGILSFHTTPKTPKMLTGCSTKPRDCTS